MSIASPDSIAADWIAADWGTSTLRVWAMDGRGRVLAHSRSLDGMAGLDPPEFEPALLRLIGGWLRPERITDVIACGMVGSRQGWVEAPYAAVPCTPRPDTALTQASTIDARLRVHVLPGLSQAVPADVMRGEETQIAGLLIARSRFDGVICLPGTHTKWAHVSAGEVVSFATFMTGELFDLLSKHSVLRHGLEDGDWSAEAFEGALDELMSRPERLAGALFGLRAQALLDGPEPGNARSRLSGLLIGLELRAARAWWLGREVVLIGTPDLAETYAAALRHCGLQAERLDATELTLAGLRAAYDALVSRGGGQ